MHKLKEKNKRAHQSEADDNILGTTKFCTFKSERHELMPDTINENVVNTEQLKIQNMFSKTELNNIRLKRC